MHFPINSTCPLLTLQGIILNAFFNQFHVPSAHITGHNSECIFQSISCALCSHYKALFNQFHVALLILQGILLNALFNKFHVPFAKVAGHVFAKSRQQIPCTLCFIHCRTRLVTLCIWQPLNRYFGKLQRPR